MKDSVAQAILAHCAQYPRLLPQDLIKFLFQSAFGCEHLVHDPSAAAGHIQRESQLCHAQTGALVEPLAGPFCQVHLAYLGQGLRAETLAKLFPLSARPEPEAKERLEALLDQASALAQAGRLPFSSQEWLPAVARWREVGFPACHHSEVFRAAYSPAYRLLRREYAGFLPLFTQIDRLLPQKNHLLVALEGGSASGKTTLSRLLAQVYDCAVYHLDDFFLRPEQRTAQRLAEPGGNLDRERFEREVLIPLRKGEPVDYRRYDCQACALLPPVRVAPNKLNILEGAYSMHPDLAPYYDLSAFLQIDPTLQRKRIQKRNAPPMAKRFFEEWIPLENQYFQVMRPQERCSFVLPVEA